jgi:hypothetical protein
VLETNRDGSFRAPDLPPGVYTVRATLPGYFAEVSRVNELDARDYYRPGDSVTIKMAKGGAITGRVTNEQGQPVIAQSVRAIRLRDFGVRAISTNGSQRETDDRGIYRLYGLPPGVYLVSVNPNVNRVSFAGEGPTYFPSATRETAQEIIIRGDEVVNEIDIRLRGQRGHIVSGAVAEAFTSGPSNGQIFVWLTSLINGGFTRSTPHSSTGGFVIYGVPDGEYNLQAWRQIATGNTDVSPPRRITVKGGDVTGIQLAFARVASITGRLVMEAARDPRRQAACESRRAFLPPETIIIARRDDQKHLKDPLPSPITYFEAAPNDQGDFVFSGLEPVRYRVLAQLPSENWYLRAITLPAAPRGRTPLDAARDGLALKPGERVKDLTVTIAEGAASVRGRLIAAEGAKLPARLRVHLVPVERERVNDLLRYAQTTAQSDGSFTFTHLAPGRYWFIARPTTDDEANVTPRPAAWDSSERARLRREAQAANIVIDLQPCQRVSDYTLRYTPLGK